MSAPASEPCLRSSCVATISGCTDVVRAILSNEHDVEDVLQQAYVNAFIHLHQFEARSRFSTWLMRIALNEAFGRRRRMRLVNVVPADEEVEATTHAMRSTQPDPERQAYAHELHHLIEQAIDALPEGYRLVFVLRDVEGLEHQRNRRRPRARRRRHQDAPAPRAPHAAPLGDRASGRCRSWCVPVPRAAMRPSRAGRVQPDCVQCRAGGPGRGVVA